MNTHRFPLPVDHSRAKFYQLRRSTLWLLIAIAFAAGLFAGGIAFGEVLVRQARAAAVEGTP